MSATLKFGNKNWATKDGSILAYNDENNNYKPLPFTFDRASTATRVNKDGLIETVGADQPRVDYLNDSKGALKLEPSRSNLFEYSEDFSQWTNTRSSDTSGFISPTGENNATKFISDNTASSSHIIKSSNFTISSGQKYTYSVFVKANQLNYVRLLFTDSAVSKFLSVYFNLSNGTVGTTSDGGTATLDSSNIENFGNGWFRCSISGDLDTTTTAHARIYLAEADNDAVIDGDGTSGVYIYGAQLEAGSYATSIINTKGSAVTRVEDSCSGAGNDQVINSTEGVLYAEIEKLVENNNLSGFDIISINDNSSNNLIAIGFDNEDDVYARIRVASDNVFTENNTFIGTNNAKLALKYKSGDIAVWLNGSKIATSASSFTLSPNTLSNLSFDYGTVGEDFYGNVKDVKLYNTALTDAELASLTQV